MYIAEYWLQTVKNGNHTMRTYYNIFTFYDWSKQEDFSFINILVFLVYAASSPNILGSSDIFLLLVFVYCFYKAVCSKKKIDKIILLPLFVFAIINILSVLKWGGMSVELLSAFIGYNLRFLISYFFLKYLTFNFFDFYHKTIFVLTIISLFCWLIQVFDIDFFHEYLDIFNMVPLTDERNRWNCLVYTAFLDKANGLARNSGFASEPAFFSFYLGFWLIIDLFKNRMNISFKFVIIAVIGLTTFSTTYCTALLLIIVLAFLSKKNARLRGILLLSTVLLAFVFTSSSFGYKKMSDAMSAAKNENIDGYNNAREDYGVSRSEYVLFSKINFQKDPIGHGLNVNGLFKTSQGALVTAGCSLLNYIVQWGVIFIIFIPILLFRFWRTLNANLSWSSYIILIIISFVWFYSGFGLKDPLYFTIISIGLLQYVPISIPITKINRCS